jgi:signal transduction histidine kinase
MENKRCDETLKQSDETNEIVFLSHKILELNKMLIDSEKIKSRFLSLIANELNNPMTALLGLIPHMRSSNGESEKVFLLVHQEALLLDFRIQNLVAAAEIESGKIDISYASVDPVEIVKEAVEDLKYLIEERNIILSIQNTPSDNIVTDPRKLYLIVKNLIANGCTYGRLNGIVDISINVVASVLEIAVNNEGPGPKVAFKPQIFTRFAEGPEGEHGLGIGLSVVRGLCEQFEGSVDYVGNKDWVTFTVTLPLSTDNRNSEAYGSNEFLFESFDDAIEM